MSNRVSLQLTLSRKLILGALGLAALATPILIGILNAPAIRAQSRCEGLTFEVASIKPSDPSSRGIRLENPGNGLRATGVTLKTLIEFAYDVQDFQISGGPGWLRSDPFDIVARPDKPDASDNRRPDNLAEEKTQAERLRERTRALLAERFRLSVRRESGERPVYALVPGKNGHKLQTASAEGRGISRNRGLIVGEGAPMEILAKILSSTVGRPVPDRTGISGKYSFRLEWTEEPSGIGKGDDSPAEASHADAAGPSIFTAIQEQLGLKLEPTKGPVEIIAIERAEKPSEN